MIGLRGRHTHVSQSVISLKSLPTEVPPNKITCCRAQSNAIA